ncbi:MAG: SCO1664 family protein [Chloroflexi bacterium]|nr:SCO1664 family protein [Chloroflexota bacterium]
MDAHPSQSQNAGASGGRAPGPRAWDPNCPDVLRWLEQAEIVATRPIPRGSNATFLVRLACPEAGESLAVYKPRRGEAPLWDFPSGTLYRRELGAYLVSQALGWPAVPPTVIRNGPYGVGTVQLYIDHQPETHYFTFGGAHLPDLQRIAAFDALTNNADRKGGHCLEDAAGRVWCIDHGLTFHTDYKLRTVVWDFHGQPIPDDLLDALQALRERLDQPDDPLVHALGELLAPAEVHALLRRSDALREAGTFPEPGPYRNTPWPMV